jgi:ankyrin repeat protein
MKNTVIILVFLFASSVVFGQNIKNVIVKGDIKKAQKWLNKGENLDQLLNVTTRAGNNFSLHPLEYASVRQKFDIAKLFVENSDKFNTIQNYYNSAFSSTIHFNNIDFTKYMLNKGVDVNMYCNTCHNAPPIAIALEYNLFDIYNLLLQEGAHLVNEDAGYDVIYAAGGCDSLPLLKHLVEVEKLNIESANKYGATPLFNAFINGKIENAKYLISKGADISKKDLKGHSILYYASNYETFKYADELLKENKISADPSDPGLIVGKDDINLFDYYVTNYTDKLKIKSKSEGEEGEDIFFGFLYSDSNINDEYFLQKLKSLNLSPKPDNNGKTAFYYVKKSKEKELIKLFEKYFDL